jgi:hypothetical protein
MQQRNVQLADWTQGPGHAADALPRAIDRVGVQRFAQHRQCLTEAAGRNARLMNRAHVPRLSRGHGIDQRFEALAKQDEERRTMVHTRG